MSVTLVAPRPIKATSVCNISRQPTPEDLLVQESPLPTVRYNSPPFVGFRSQHADTQNHRAKEDFDHHLQEHDKHRVNFAGFGADLADACEELQEILRSSSAPLTNDVFPRAEFSTPPCRAHNPLPLNRPFSTCGGALSASSPPNDKTRFRASHVF